MTALCLAVFMPPLSFLASVSAPVLIWPQPLSPLPSLLVSALVAAVPLVFLLILMGGLRKGGLFSAACGIAVAGALAVLVWRMPFALALRSAAFGFVYGLWPIMWIVFTALWLYNLCVDTGKFELRDLRMM